MDADLPIEKIRKCVGDPEADVENEVLKVEQEVQVILLTWSALCCSLFPTALKMSRMHISFLN